MEMTDSVRALLAEGNGILMASSAARAGLQHASLSQLVERGILEKVDRGAYVLAGEMDDELYTIQQRAKQIIYSHETALYLHRLTDRTPFRYSITVPSDYKPSSSIRERCKVYYVNRERITIGKVQLASGMGHIVTAYDMERTICDVLRSRNKMDSQAVSDALRFYAGKKEKNLNRLYEYAGRFGVLKLLKPYLEVLL